MEKGQSDYYYLDTFTDDSTEPDVITTIYVFIEKDIFTEQDDLMNTANPVLYTTVSTLNDGQQLPSIPAVVILLIVLCGATLANGLVLYLTKQEKVSQEAYIYIRAVYAVVDIMLVWSTVPFILYKAYYDVGSSTVLLCYAGDFGVGMFLITVHLTILMALERYYYFCHPMKYPRFFNKKSIALICALIIIFNQVMFFFFDHKNLEY